MKTELRQKLINALRDKSQWPKDFRWSFVSLAGCALGLGSQLGFWYDMPSIPRALGLSHRDINRIFSDPFPNEHDPKKLKKLLNNRTAEDVAKDLEEAE